MIASVILLLQALLYKQRQLHFTNNNAFRLTFSLLVASRIE
jgi:hypothetical protein